LGSENKAKRGHFSILVNLREAKKVELIEILIEAESKKEKERWAKEVIESFKKACKVAEKGDDDWMQYLLDCLEIAKRKEGKE